MATKVFQRGNFVVIEKDSKETIVPIDNFDYNFTTPTEVKLKDVVEGNEISSGLADLQNEAGTPIGSVNDVNDYFATFLKLSSSTPPTGGATEAKQDVINDQTIAKKIGYVLDLEADNDGNWSGFPVGFDNCVLTFTNKVVEFNGFLKSLANTKELADFLNDNQNDLFFVELEANKKLYFIGRNETVPEIQEIALDEQVSAGNNLEYFTPFSDTADQVTGALHECVILLNKIVAGHTISSVENRRFEVLAAQSITFESYKQLEVVCHSPDGSFNFVYNDGAVLTLPFTDSEDGGRIKGISDNFNGAVYRKKLVVTNNSASNYFISYSITK